MALDNQALNTFLTEEKIDLKRVGSAEFFITSNPLSPSVSVGLRRAMLNVSHSANLARETGFIEEKSRDLSSGIAAFLFLAQDTKFWQYASARQLFEREQLRLITKMDPQKIPPFSLWRQIPD